MALIVLGMRQSQGMLQTLDLLDHPRFAWSHTAAWNPLWQFVFKGVKAQIAHFLFSAILYCVERKLQCDWLECMRSQDRELWVFTRDGRYITVVTVTSVMLCNNMVFAILSFTIIALTPFGFSAHMELYLPHHTEHPHKERTMISLISKSLMKLWN